MAALTLVSRCSFELWAGRFNLITSIRAGDAWKMRLRPALKAKKHQGGILLKTQADMPFQSKMEMSTCKVPTGQTMESWAGVCRRLSSSSPTSKSLPNLPNCTNHLAFACKGRLSTCLAHGLTCGSRNSDVDAEINPGLLQFLGWVSQDSQTL